MVYLPRWTFPSTEEALVSLILDFPINIECKSIIIYTSMTLRQNLVC